MNAPIFDSHAHYTSRQFDGDRYELLAGLPAQGVTGIVECATSSRDAVQAVALAHRFDFVWAAVGIHPESLIEEHEPTVSVYHGDWAAELRDMEPLFADERVVAVGECGLDHHWPVPREEQLAMLEGHLRLAAELDKPVILHDREAHAEMYELIRKYRPKGVLHCYSGSAEDAKWLTRMGLYIGFGGSTTFKNARRSVEAAQVVPPELMLLETDCPYLAPIPYRGKRNHSGLILHTAEHLAKELGTTCEELLTRTDANARRLFGLSAE
ncbi:MAG: TatD family hydrolase [Oscillospiraceae bacterium]|nr:TatD family hydrolase [Oscillospiraceae bacterium]